MRVAELLLISKIDGRFSRDVKTKGGITLDFIMYYFTNQISGLFDEIDFFNNKILVNTPNERPSIDEALNLWLNFKFSIWNKEHIKKKFIFDTRYCHDEVIDVFLAEIASEATNYLTYLNRRIKVFTFLIDFDQKIDNIDNIHDLLSPTQLSALARYMNNFLLENYKLKQFVVTEESLIEEFDEYVELRNINKYVFISYYSLLIREAYMNASANSFLYSKAVKQVCDYSIFSNEELKREYIENCISKVKLELFNNVDDGHFQFQGIFERKESFFIDVKQSLIDYLKLVNINNDGDRNKRIIIQYKKEKLDIAKSISYLKLTFLKNYRNNIGNNINPLQADFNKVIQNNIKYKNYLTGKGFSGEEIIIIFNLLSQSQYKDLGIKYISNIKQVDFFRFCYAFYLFDFYTEIEGYSFSTIKSFDVIFSFDEKNSINIDGSEQMRKYYLNMTNSNNKHYPFNSYNKICNDLQKNLSINREKLKSIN
ncbi:hypothetical protein [Chryseobacterium bernardetii]|uniref:hypothetical protein n=1 Tax=Chryseobacterium bernardetii TaxID=1241978 RepID=UPI003AF62D04